MANYVFKHFCAELDEASLDHLLQIIAKPVANDLDMLEADSDSDEDSSDEEDDIEEAEIEGQDEGDQEEDSDDQ